MLKKPKLGSVIWFDVEKSIFESVQCSVWLKACKDKSPTIWEVTTDSVKENVYMSIKASVFRFVVRSIRKFLET
jgi:hypothetical protein